jgi:chromosome segregation ATPase
VVIDVRGIACLQGGKVYQELKAARSELAEKLDTVTENLEEAKAENETLLGEVNDLMALNSDLAREQMELRDVSDAKEADWELQRTALEGALASLRIDLDAASDASASVQTAKANKALKPQLEALQLKLKTFEEKNRTLKEEHKELDDEHTAVLDEVRSSRFAYPCRSLSLNSM